MKLYSHTRILIVKCLTNFVISQPYDLWWAWTQSGSLTTIQVRGVWELVVSHCQLRELELCEFEWSFYLFPAHLSWPWQLNVGFSLASSTYLIGKVTYIQAWMTRENQSNLTEILTVLESFYFPLYLISLLVLISCSIASFKIYYTLWGM